MRRSPPKAPQETGRAAPPVAGDPVAAARGLHGLGRLGDAEAAYRRILAVRPDDPEVLQLLGVVRAQRGAHGEAVGLLKAAVARAPRFGLAWFNLANALRDLGDLEAAAAAYRRAAPLLPRPEAAELNLGALLRTSGRAEEAVTVYREALRRAPGSADLRYGLGCALQHLGRWEVAAEAYREVLKTRPEHGDALANLASCALELGAATEALEASRRRVALDPRAPDARLGLSRAFRAAGRPGDAAAAARAALSLTPGLAEAWIELGSSLLEAGEAEPAAAAFERGLALEPQSLAALLGRGVALQEAGRTAEALAAAERAVAEHAGSAAAWALLAGLRRFERGGPELAALERLAGRGAASVEDQVTLEFALGRALLDAGEPERAFRHLETANQRHRRSFAYAVEADAAELRRIAEAFDAALLAARADAGPPSERPVFVIGMPRSGTTLVEQILASHPEVAGAGELPLLEALALRALGAAPGERRPLADLSNLDPAGLHALGAAYLDGLPATFAGARRVVDKMPSNFRLAGLIRLSLPQARIVSVRRDPRDTCVSCYVQRFTRGQPFAYDLYELGAYYRAYDALTAHWRKVLPPDRFLEIAYEDLVEDLEGETRRLLVFCGMGWDEACLSFHATTRTVRTASVNQVRRPLYAGSVGRWRALEGHLGPLTAGLGGAGRKDPGAA